MRTLEQCCASPTDGRARSLPRGAAVRFEIERGGAGTNLRNAGGMNILFVTHAPPLAPLDGASLILHHLARELAAPHTLYLCSLYAGERPNETRLSEYFADVRLAPMPTRSWSVKWAESLNDSTPLWVRAYDVPALRLAVREMLDTYPIDVVHCDTGLMAQYVDVLHHAPHIVAPHDSLTRVLEQNAQIATRPLERMAARLQVDKMRRYEATTYPCFDRVVVVSAREREYLLSLAPALNVSVIPNGVHTDEFAPSAAPVIPYTLGFLGAMDYAPNRDAALDFAREILPRMQREIAEATFTIIGRNPRPDVCALANDPRIRVTGTVDDVRPYVAAQSVMVCPMRASGGIKNKVLEALAMGKPVV